MPDKTISILSATAGMLVVLYLGLIVTTISFAAQQTDLREASRTTESKIVELESTYYETMTTLSGVSPSSIGLVKPVTIEYAVRTAAPTLSLR